MSGLRTVRTVLPERIVYVTGTVNGTDRIWTKVNGAWETVVPRARDDTYQVELTATTAAGLTETFALTLYSGLKTLITDRTASHVDRVRRIQDKLNAGTATEAERTALLADLRGSYDHRALNRVGLAVRYLTERLASHGFNMTTSPRINWTAGDVPTYAEWARYLADIEQIRSRYQVTAATPETPATMDRLTYSQANDIEQILLDVDALAELAEHSWMYSGEAFAGEF